MNSEVPAVKRSRRGSGAVTLHDVARLAGVAPITASRALNTPSQVSADVRKKVTDAVQRVGYVRNHLAGGLASTAAGWWRRWCLPSRGRCSCRPSSR